MKSNRQIFVVAILITLFFILISTPYQFDFNHYFAVSTWLWGIYYGLGFLLSLYVFWVFVRALKVLMNHDEE